MIVKLQEECRDSTSPVGVNVDSGEVLQPVDAGIFDNYCVKKQILNSWFVIFLNLNFKKLSY